MTLANDLPIEKPEDDAFGLDPFASALAVSIAKLEAGGGMVLAINGAWGSGKSSAVNLIRHHLEPAVQTGDVQIVTFNPWWFSGPDALTLALFQELSRAIGPSLAKGFDKSIAVIGQGVSSVGALAGAIADMKLPGLGTLISSGAGVVGKLTGGKRGVEQEHARVSAELRKQKKRFVVVIDDIDRLNPDDAMTIFRLVKSVGRLPNVIYLLAFDRRIADRIVAEQFPSEGPGYLEKILQGTFDLPPLSPDALREHCASAVFKITGEPPESGRVRFWNIFQDVVAPTISTPRDVVRLTNQLSVTWPALDGEVDRADFLAITALQLAEPAVYDAIRRSREALCDTAQLGGRQEANVGERYDERLAIAGRAEPDKARLRIALRRLFPRLDAVWSNTFHQGEEWRRDRLIASSTHFPSYFAFSISDDIVPAATVRSLVERAGEPEFIKSSLRAALAVGRRAGGTRAALLLDELKVHADDIDPTRITPLVSALFEIADELDVVEDSDGGFMGVANNQFRLHWLLNRLVNDRLTESARDAVYQAAMALAPVDWATNFAERCLGPFQREDEGGRRRSPIVSEPVAEKFREIGLARLGAASMNGTLVTHRKLCSLMFTWSRLAGLDGDAIVRAWTDAQLADPAFIVALARDIPSASQALGLGWDGMGDRVATQNIFVDLSAYATILDVERLEARVAELLAGDALGQGDLDALRAFAAAPRRARRAAEADDAPDPDAVV